VLLDPYGAVFQEWKLIPARKVY